MMLSGGGLHTADVLDSGAAGCALEGDAGSVGLHPLVL
jgi:hypothetical protein